MVGENKRCDMFDLSQDLASRLPWHNSLLKPVTWVHPIISSTIYLRDSQLGTHLPIWHIFCRGTSNPSHHVAWLGGPPFECLFMVINLVSSRRVCRPLSWRQYSTTHINLLFRSRYNFISSELHTTLANACYEIRPIDEIERVFSIHAWPRLDGFGDVGRVHNKALDLSSLSTPGLSYWALATSIIMNRRF